MRPFISITLIINILTVIGFIVANTTHTPVDLSTWVVGCSYAWLIIAILFNFLSYRRFVVGFLLSLLAVLVQWRIGWLNSIYWFCIPATVNFFWMVITFFVFVRKNLHSETMGLINERLTQQEWSLTFLRIVVGMNFIPHFAEKLFAGPIPHAADVTAFANLGLPAANIFVWLAGICEMGLAMWVGLGLFTRLGSICAAVYLLICLFVGQHELHGFDWFLPGGGWEFPLFWAVLLLGVGVIGGGRFSIDNALKDRFINLPDWLLKIMG